MPEDPESVIRRVRRTVTVWAMVMPLTLAGALAQTPAQCEGQGNLSANTQLQVSQLHGRALVEIVKPSSAGRKIEIEYGDELYSLKFGADNRIRAGFALTAAVNQITINMIEAAPIVCALNVPDFNKMYRVILRWRDPVQLDLNVLEPGGRTDETGHVTAVRPNTNLSQGIGMMDVISSVPTEGATAELSYVVPEPTRIPANGVFGFKVDYVTRGVQPDAPYCDNHPLATPKFEFITIEGGNVTTRRMSASRAKCREKISDARRLMPIRQ